MAPEVGIGGGIVGGGIVGARGSIGGVNEGAVLRGSPEGGYWVWNWAVL